MRVAVLGGSFHPPHVGHAMVAAWLRWTDTADEVWLLPTFRHAFAKELAPWEHRLAWCAALAEAVGPWVRVCDAEGEHDGTSYTVDTLDRLARKHPACLFRLVVGADVLPDTPRWKDWARLSQAYTPIVVGRAGYPEVNGVPTFPAISSTQVRDALARGDDVSAWVPAAVLRALAATGPW